MIKLLLIIALLGSELSTAAKEPKFDPLREFIPNSTDQLSKNIDDVVPVLPDPCTMTPFEGSLITKTLQVPGYGSHERLRIVAEESVWPEPGQPIELVLIVNGNKYPATSYSYISNYLARNGFVVGAVQRNGASASNPDPQLVIDTLQTIYDYLQLRPNISITLIGHSVGGSVVNNAAILNEEQGLGYPIDAIINVAPNSKNSGKLNGKHTSSFLALYGSRDLDMSGTGNSLPKEAFKVFDETGTENSTACNNLDCYLLSPLIDKSMTYIYGADHAEILGTETKNPYGHDVESYLSEGDQSCIGRAYLNGFLRWKIRGEDVFKGFIRGQWTPESILDITTSKPDGLGHPTGSKVRVYHQFSPPLKQSIENWEDGAYSLAYKSPLIQTSLIPKNDEFFYKNANYRHWTNSVLVAWKAKNHYQYWGLTIPNDTEHNSSFSHLSFRAGQLLSNEVVTAEYQNLGIDQVIWVGLRDKMGKFAWKKLNGESLPWVDRHSAMSTIIIPLNDFNGINHTKIAEVYFAFPPSSQGSLMFDNIEWIKY